MSEESELSGLPGEGKPLDLSRDEQAATAGPRSTSSRTRSSCRLRAAGRADQLRALSADRIMDAARATGVEEACVRAAVASWVTALNVKVGRFNPLVPVASLQLAPLRSEPFFEPKRV